MEVLEGVTNVLKEEVRDEMMKQVGSEVKPDGKMIKAIRIFSSLL